MAWGGTGAVVKSSQPLLLTAPSLFCTSPPYFWFSRWPARHNCPKPLLRLATLCCDLEVTSRPSLAQAVQELECAVARVEPRRAVLHTLSPNELEAQRPTARLRGWRAAVEAVSPSLVGVGAGGTGGGGTSNGEGGLGTHLA